MMPWQVADQDEDEDVPGSSTNLLARAVYDALNPPDDHDHNNTDGEEATAILRSSAIEAYIIVPDHGQTTTRSKTRSTSSMRGETGQHRPISGDPSPQEKRKRRVETSSGSGEQ